MALSGIKKWGMGVAAFATAITGGIGLTPTNNLTVGTAPAQAQAGCLPGNYDPSHIVQPGDCYASWSAFSQAMRAENQQPLITGNRSAGVYKYGEMFNADANGRGFSAGMNVPYDNRLSATEIRIGIAYIHARVNDVNASSRLPTWASAQSINDSQASAYCRRFNTACSPYSQYIRDIGANGQNTNGQDNRIMFLAEGIHSPAADGTWATGKRVVIFRDMNDGYGHINFLSLEGAVTPSFVMQPVGYTQFAAARMGEQHASNDEGTKPPVALALNP